MEIKYTPGPWECFKTESVGKDGTPVYGIGFGISGYLGEVVGEENAKLVAQAPEMHGLIHKLADALKRETLGIIPGQFTIDALNAYKEWEEKNGTT